MSTATDMALLVRLARTGHIVRALIVHVEHLAKQHAGNCIIAAANLHACGLWPHGLKMTWTDSDRDAHGSEMA